MPNSGFRTLLDARFGDVEQLCSEVQHWDLRFQPLLPHEAGSGIGRVIQGHTDRFECSYARFLLNLDQRGAPPDNRFTFTVPGSSLNHLWWQGKSVGNNDVLVYFPGTEMRSISSRDFEVHLISMSFEEILHLADRSGVTIPALSRLPTVFSAPEGLANKARNLLGRIKTTSAFLDDCELDALAEDLIRCWLAQIGIQCRKDRSPASLIVIEEILNAVAERNAASVRVSDLCSRSGISRRTLELAFQDRFGTGPATFLKNARLAQARQSLSQASRETGMVADAMSQAGFSHVGQFATDYRRLFGELPSETLGRAS